MSVCVYSEFKVGPASHSPCTHTSTPLQIKDIQRTWRASAFIIGALIHTGNLSRATAFSQAIRSVNLMGTILTNMLIKEFAGGLGHLEAVMFVNWVIQRATHSPISRLMLHTKLDALKHRTNVRLVVMNPNCKEFIHVSQRMYYACCTPASA